jgi:hypothetical protein
MYFGMWDRRAVPPFDRVENQKTQMPGFNLRQRRFESLAEAPETESLQDNAQELEANG